MSEKLKRYLTNRDMSATEFAISLGVAPSTITRILLGESSPRIALAAAIEKKTRGRVRMTDFLPSKEIGDEK